MTLSSKRKAKSSTNLVTVNSDENTGSLGEILHRSMKNNKSTKNLIATNELLLPDAMNNPDSDLDLGVLTSDERTLRYRSKCLCDTHFDKVFLDLDYNIVADKMFDLIFGTNEFVRTYRQAQHIFEDKATKWSTNENNFEERVLTYKVPYESTFVGKGTISARERQTVLKKEPGFYYVVETELNNSGVRYSDAFSLIMRYCILQTSATTTHLLITAQVRFCKSVLGFIRQLIERNAFSASLEGFKDLNNRLNLISNFKKEKRLLSRDGITFPVPVLKRTRGRPLSRHDAVGIKLSSPTMNQNDYNILSMLSRAGPILIAFIFSAAFLIIIQIYLYLKLRYMDILADNLSKLMKISSPSSSKRRS